MHAAFIYLCARYKERPPVRRMRWRLADLVGGTTFLFFSSVDLIEWLREKVFSLFRFVYVVTVSERHVSRDN